MAKLGEYDFIGEMSFLIWDKSKLIDLLSKNANLLHRFEGAIGKQLIDKMIEQSKCKREAEVA